MRRCLTTIDNPFDPFDQWDEWYTWDMAHGYNTCGLLARFAVLSDDWSEKDQEQAIDEAIDEIMYHNPTGMHTIATKP